MWTTDEAKALARECPEARDIVFEHTGHLMFADEPVRFIEVMEVFSQGARPKSRRKK